MDPASPKTKLEETVYQATLEHLQNHEKAHLPTNLHKVFLELIEYPLCKAVLEHTQGNHTKAAAILGINRATLNKKIKKIQKK